MTNSGCPYSTAWPFSPRIRDGAGLVGLDLVEDLHGLDDADGLAFLTWLPTSTKGLAPGLEER
jgi:hypothetical protein